METYGAFSKDLWNLVTVLTDPASHPHASGDYMYDTWCRPEPRRDFFLSLAFAAQRGGSKMLREAGCSGAPTGRRRRRRRSTAPPQLRAALPLRLPPTRKAAPQNLCNARA